MAAYPLFSQTIQALRGTGQTLTGLAQLDAERKAAESAHGLNMAKLGLQGEQIKGQQALGLAQLDASQRQRAEDVAFRNRQLGLTEANTQWERERQQAIDDERRWMNEAGSFENLYRGSLAKQGMKPEEIDATIGKFAGIAGGLGRQILSAPTIRSKMYDIIGDVPNWLRAEAQAQRAAGKNGGASLASDWEFNKKYVAPIVENFTGDPQSNEGKGIKAQARTAGSIAYAWQEPVIVDGIPAVDEKGNQIVKNKWYSIPARVAYEANQQLFWADIIEQAPRAASLPYEQKVQLMSEIANDPTQRGNILNKYKVGVAENPETGGKTSRGVTATFPQQRTGYFSQGGEGIPGIIYDTGRGAYGAAQGLNRTLEGGIRTLGQSVYNTPQMAGTVFDRAFPQVQRTIIPALTGR